jgi:hypothetical protein
VPKPKKLRGPEANFRALFRAYRSRANKKRIPFTLTPERFRELTKSPCLICGAKPKQRYIHDKSRAKLKRAYIYNGVDRLDSKEGYIDGNVAPCCWRCNCAKASLSLEEFLLYILDAYNHAIKPALQEGMPE